MMASSPRYVAGVHAGGTKTVGLLASETGNVVAEARSTGCNLQTHGELELEKVLSSVIDDLGGVQPIAALCLGVGGVDRPQDEAAVRNVLRRVGHRGAVRIVGHSRLALVAGTPDGIGIALLAGSGAIAYGVDRRGGTARAGGYGGLLSDEGSGYWLGHEALRAAVRGVDGRGPETLLSSLVFASLGVQSLADLVPLACEKGLPRYQIATLAGQVQKATDRSDPVARELLDRTAHELVMVVRAVERKLDFAGDDYPVILGGGLFRACPSLMETVGQRLDLPHARPTPLETEPATGALALARHLLTQ
jgi:N-acetylglucosamine kinase-like BadF-type ATPase